MFHVHQPDLLQTTPLVSAARLTAIALTIGLLPLSAADYYVSPGGANGNDGSLASPWKTIQKAANTAQAGDTIHIRAGVYREQVTPLNAGNTDSPIVFKAYNNEEVVISGCDQLTNWTALGDGTYEAPMNWTLEEYRNQLFVNGSSQIKARWPNVADNDPLTPDAAAIDETESGMSRLRAKQALPSSWSASSLDGASVWILAEAKWRAWNSRVTHFDPTTGQIDIQEASAAWYVGNMNPSRVHRLYGDSTFFLSGSRDLLDAPGEWWFDSINNKMILIPPAGVDPTAAGTQIEAKKRSYGFVLKNKSHIHLNGLEFRGCSTTLEGAQSCQINRAKFYEFDYREGETHFTKSPYYTSPGIKVSGAHNIIRDSEFHRCSDAGVTLEGDHNALINCHLHEVDYAGYNGGPINLGGRGHLVSHNTVERTSRKGISPAGLAHLVQYNHVRETGLVTRDQGAIYAGGFDGGNTIIRYNLVNVSNGNPEGYGSGIYLDNYNQNVHIHHNIVWNTTTNGLQPNRPSHFTTWAHNTVWNSDSSYSDISTNYGPWAGQETMLGSLIHNNITNGEIDPKNHARDQWGNHQSLAPLDFSSGLPVATSTPAGGADTGSFLPGINDRHHGNRPDAGALENGADVWQAGHNFVNPPNPTYQDASHIYYRNYLSNGGFDFQRVKYSPKFAFLDSWSSTGSATAAGAYFSGFNDPAAEARNSIHGNSAHLQGPTDDGLKQAVRTLPPGDYLFTAYVRLRPSETPSANDSEVKLSVLRNGTEIASTLASTVSLSGDQAWRLVKVPFQQSETSDITVQLTKTGPGRAYIDNIGLIPRYADDKPLASSDLPVQNGLLLHLDASQISTINNGEVITEWQNLASESLHATAAEDIRPSYQATALNGQPALRFDGVNDALSIPTLRAETGNLEFFIIASSSSTEGSKWQRLLSAYTQGTKDSSAPNWVYLRPKEASGTPLTFPPSVLNFSYGSNDRHIANLQIARHGISAQSHFAGDIAEVIIFNRRLSSWERNEIGHHLAKKYSIHSDSFADPDSDQDNDGMNHRDELITGTDPNNISDFLQLELVETLPSQTEFSFPTVIGVTYYVERSLGLTPTDWHVIKTLTGNNTEKQIIAELPEGTNKAFYRVRAEIH